ncbi:hypothetical protein G9A89_005914 [Geosiphon pyriformis]|nr:hypothetical protein G9A89_005914 [Geosiphon pyriformis]
MTKPRATITSNKINSSTARELRNRTAAIALRHELSDSDDFDEGPSKIGAMAKARVRKNITVPEDEATASSRINNSKISNAKLGVTAKTIKARAKDKAKPKKSIGLTAKRRKIADQDDDLSISEDDFTGEFHNQALIASDEDDNNEDFNHEPTDEPGSTGRWRLLKSIFVPYGYHDLPITTSTSPLALPSSPISKLNESSIMKPKSIEMNTNSQNENLTNPIVIHDDPYEIIVISSSSDDETISSEKTISSNKTISSCETLSAFSSSSAKQRKKSTLRFHKFGHEQEARLNEAIEKINGEGGLLNTWLAEKKELSLNAKKEMDEHLERQDDNIKKLKAGFEKYQSTTTKTIDHLTKLHTQSLRLQRELDKELNHLYETDESELNESLSGFIKEQKQTLKSLLTVNKAKP